MVPSRALTGTGRFCYNPAVPPLAAAAFEQALAHHRAGRLDAAETLYRATLDADPKHFHALHFLGLLRHRRGDFDEALRLLRKALNQNPASADANHGLGLTLAALGRHDEAIARYEKAIAQKPDFAEAFNSLGNALATLGRSEAAVAAYRRALDLAPGYAEAMSNLGLALLALGQEEEAVAAFTAALDRKPDFAEAALNLGNALLEAGRPAEALAAYERAAALAPYDPRMSNNLGRALEALDRREAAIAAYERAVTLAPDYAGAQWNLALARLAIGDLQRGFEGYEWRWRTGDLTPRDFAVPRWEGEDPAGRTILVHAEQGLGDTLQFARYVPLLAARGARIVLEAQKPLVPLLQSLAGAAAVIAAGEALPPFGLHCPLLSLPLLFGTTLDTIPATVPYLRAPPERIARWGAALPEGGGLRIGVAWAGSLSNRNDRVRSLPLAALAPLLQRQGPRWFSLQKELREGDAALLETLPGVSLLGDDLTDFADTAAVMSALDLVITVDTATAHLAGALGCPVWLLLPFAAEWRWLRGREDSPWYPTARLFRQNAPGEWSSVVARVAAALDAW